eukprot:768775-Hanusia_phi.AAC.6
MADLLGLSSSLGGSVRVRSRLPAAILLLQPSHTRQGRTFHFVSPCRLSWNALPQLNSCPLPYPPAWPQVRNSHRPLNTRLSSSHCDFHPSSRSPD